MLLELAIRNIRAHGRRSLLTILLGAVSTGLLVFSTAWMDGSHAQMIRNAVEIYPGYLQITGASFRESPSYEHLIFDVERLSGLLAREPGVADSSPRFESFVLFARDEKAVGGMLTGLVPAREAAVSRLRDSLVAGRYLEKGDSNQLYLGKELARRLGVGVGDELAFVGSGADYSFAADRLRVVGIFQTGLFDFDAASAFMAKDYFDTIMAAENQATHIIVQPRDPGQAPELARRLATLLGPEYQAASWRETMAPLVKAMEIDSLFGYLTLAVIFIVIFFVIMIYTLLLVYARIREIGIMRALGTTPGQVLTLLLLESALLGLLSVLLGGLIGGAFAYYYSVHPMVFASMEEQFRQYGLAVSAIPAAFAPLVILRDMALMYLLLLLSTLYPIIKVNGLPPIEAIHHV
ncbi:MAG: FtsX-like permease family protein [Thermodesulfobacteriota bacterium]